jgi:hypothetical protein
MPRESGSGQRPCVSPRSKSVASSTSWAIGSSIYKDRAPLEPATSYLRPHPSDAGRKPVLSPAGEVADKGRKWGGCLPGSFETGKK